ASRLMVMLLSAGSPSTVSVPAAGWNVAAIPAAARALVAVAAPVRAPPSTSGLRGSACSRAGQGYPCSLVCLLTGRRFGSRLFRLLAMEIHDRCAGNGAGRRCTLLHRAVVERVGRRVRNGTLDARGRLVAALRRGEATDGRQPLD